MFFSAKNIIHTLTKYKGSNTRLAGIVKPFPFPQPDHLKCAYYNDPAKLIPVTCRGFKS